MCVLSTLSQAIAGLLALFMGKKAFLYPWVIKIVLCEVLKLFVNLSL